MKQASRKLTKLEKTKLFKAKMSFKKLMKQRKKKKNKITLITNFVPKIKKEERTNYRKFLRGKYWKYVRLIILNRDGNSCVRCKSVTNLQIHHLTYKNHLKEHQNLTDLITLCEKCHEEEHKKTN